MIEYTHREKRLLAELREVEQVLGKVLGYPAYCDDPKNFPGTTPEDGVCVGEHTSGTLAAEAANKIRELKEEIVSMQSQIDWLNAHIEGELE